MMLELINVALNFGDEDIAVGRLIAKQKQIFFEFDQAFLKNPLPISPLNLPTKAGAQSFDPYLFEGLPGVFNDSLPDGWGRLLLDRYTRTQGINPRDLAPVDRLSHVGSTGMGALVYKPDNSERQNPNQTIHLDFIAEQSQTVLKGSATEILDQLVALNGSSAGARPKAVLSVSQDKKNIRANTNKLPNGYTHWLVKFANQVDGQDSGAIEYVYSQLAKLAGLDIPETYLFPAANCAGYFATQRFDRIGNKRLHVHTACGLLHTDFRIPALDYEDLLRLTLMLTRDVREVEKMYRLAVFNVLAHNRDDHAKNFTYLMDAAGNWRLSPAYDLTFSSGPNGEQSTSVLGEGRHPTVEHLQRLAIKSGINAAHALQIIEQCKDALAQWPVLAKAAGVSRDSVQLISQGLFHGAQTSG